MAEINEKLIAEVVRQVLMNASAGSGTIAPRTNNGLSAADYPLGVKRPELLKSPKGTPFKELTLDSVLAGKVGFDDFKISPEVLKMQGEIAIASGRPAIAKNLQRAAEMTKIPDDRVLEMYNALRPHRSTKEQLESLAVELESKYDAKVCAAFVREAADVYQRRKLLKGDLPSQD